MSLPVNNAEILDRIMARESGGRPKTASGLVNNAADRGGPTSIWGITQAQLSKFRGRPVSITEVGSLRYDDAMVIYLERYIIEPGFNLISNPALRYVVVDANVNHGPVATRKLVQRALGVMDDGVWGPQTLAALAQANQQKLATRVCTMRARLYAAIVAGNLEDKDRDGVPDNVEFIKGWTDRAMDMIEELVA